MSGTKLCKLASLLLILVFGAPGIGRADYPCPEPQQGRWHPVGLHYQQHSYFLPQAHRLCACFRPRMGAIYASDLHPEVPLTYNVQHFPCPFATPAVIYAGGRQP